MFQYADYIYAVYKEKSFTAAAKKLYISQPSLSAAIKRAEEKLGFLIFDRSSSPPVLTDAGHVYINAVEEMNKVKRNLKNYVQNIHSLTYGDVVLSGNSFISAFVLPPMMKAFAEQYPSIRLFSEEGHSAQLYDKLLNEESDVLVGNELDVDEFVAWPLCEERLLLAVPKSDALYAQFGEHALSREDVLADKHLLSNLSLSSYDGDTLIHLERGPMRGQSSRLCAELSLSFRKVITTDQLLTAVALAEAGLGATFVTDTLVKSAPPYPHLAFFALPPSAKQTLYIAHKKKAYLSPAVAEFIRFAREFYGHDIDEHGLNPYNKEN